MSAGSDFENLYNKAKELHSHNKNNEYESLLSQILQKGSYYFKTAFSFL